MHLVKWLRKNMQKVMVFVVIAIMVAFVLGSGVKFIFDSVFNPAKRVVATYDDGRKIKWVDTQVARNELQILRWLNAEQILAVQSNRGQQPGPMLLLHLLFPDSPLAAQIPSVLKQSVQGGRLPITMNELEDYFQQQRQRPDILWILLREEAHRAGYMKTAEQMAQLVNSPESLSSIRNAAAKANQTQEQVLQTFGDLISIIEYFNSVTNSHAVTTNQIKASLGRSKERIDAEFVKIDAASLVDKNAEISDAQIQQQFDTYKAVVPNIPTNDNPFGFGYQLPKRVRLEYMVVLMDDVKKQTENPTANAIEEYYSSHMTQFQKEVLSDPNNPESEKIKQTQPFVEVEAQIRSRLEAEKTNTQANILFNEVKDKTEAGFEELNFDEATAAELQKAAEEGNYVTVGDELSKKYNIPISVGKTGWLDATALGKDKVLSSLYIRRRQDYLRLNDLVFIATEEKSQRQHIGLPSVRVWENIGPLSGGYYAAEEQKFYPMMAMVRVVEIKDTTVPDNVNLTFDTKGVELSILPKQEDTSVSLIERVKDDIRLMKAMDAARARAEELAGMVVASGWDEAVKAYNEKYAKPEDNTDTAELSDALKKRIELETIKQRLRMSQASVEQIKRAMLQDPALAQYSQQQLAGAMLVDRLYALLDKDAESTGTIQTVLAFEPEQCCYVVKEVVRQPATIADYTDNKAQESLQLSAVEAIPLALVHFSPENIAERMAYQSKQPEQEQPQQGQEEAEPAKQPQEPSAENEAN